MAQTFRFLCALLLLGAFCGLTKTQNITTPPSTTGSNTTSLTNTTTGGNETSPPTPTTGGNDTSPPTPTPGNNDTSLPNTTTGGNTTIPPTTTPGNNDTSLPNTTTGGNTTIPPTTTPGDNATSPPAPPPGDACSSSPCGPGSTCESRAGGAFECLCLPGAYYNQITCVIAKVFPGELTFGSIPFSESLANKTSALFQVTSEQVTGSIGQVFEGDNSYRNSTVLEFRPAQTRNQQTTASVHIIFDLAAAIDESTVFERIQNCPTCNVTDAVPRNLCNAQPCDLTSTTCEAGNGTFTCSCKSDYIKLDFSERMCIACPSGQQAVDNRCTDCPFGYSGFNCAEHWKLALVIVAAVLGAVLLITLIVLVTVVVRSKKRSKASSTAAIGKPYTSRSPANSPLVNGSKGAPAMTGMPRIPRATAQNGAGFNLEMTPSNSRQNLISSGGNSRHYDDVLAHGQNRPQSNPYTSNRGHDNPYNKYDGR